MLEIAASIQLLRPICTIHQNHILYIQNLQAFIVHLLPHMGSALILDILYAYWESLLWIRM